MFAKTSVFFLAVGLTVTCLTAMGQTTSAQSPAPQRAGATTVGTVKAVNGNRITVTADVGTEFEITAPEGTRILRTAPGRKDLKDAAPAQVSDVQAGDRVLARGQPSGDGKSIVASSIVLMKHADIVQAQENERQDWQKRGVGGLVGDVDPEAHTVTISNLGPAGKINTIVRVTKDTIIRRYAPDSVRFDDAKPGTFNDIKKGDQLRARGTRNPDATEIAAEEIVSGAFRNIAGTVNATDPAKNTITVTDLATKKAVAVAISPDSQLRKLPPMVAQRLAMRFRPGAATAGPSGGSPAGTAPAAASARDSGIPPAPASSRGVPPSGVPGGPPGGPRGAGDLQQMLARMPSVAIADLQKGDAVMIVATEGSATLQPTVITLLAGVEPILTAAPSGAGAMLLSPWNLSTSMPDSAGP